MGPLRAFSRPSHVAGPGQFASSASPYSPTQRYSAQHRSCCTHSALSLPHHHPGTPFPNLYSSVYATDPLRASLGASSATLQPCLIHIKNKLLPPGETTEESHHCLSTQQGRREVGGQGEREEGDQREEWSGWSLQDEKEWNSSEECQWKKDRDRQKWKGVSGEAKSNNSNGQHDDKWPRKYVAGCKRSREESDDSDSKRGESPWKKSRNSYKWKNNSKESCKWKKSADDLEWKRGENNVNEYGKSEWAKDDNPPEQRLSPAVKEDEPCTSGMSLQFPLTDDEDEEVGSEDRAARGSEQDTWPISDIVETEDEGGEERGSQGRCDGEGDTGSVDCYGADGCSVVEDRDSRGCCDGEGDASVVNCYDGDGFCAKKNRDCQGRDGKGDAGNVDCYGQECHGRCDGEVADTSAVSCYGGDGCGVVKVNGVHTCPEPDLVNIVITQVGKQQQQQSGGGAEKDPGGEDSCGPSESDCLAGGRQDERVNSLSVISARAAETLQVKGVEGRDNGESETGEERREEEEEEEEEESGEGDGRRGEEEDSPRDGPRATQRLRPRSYRQFLLTRERRSRVFLKARSRELGRWFVTHFTHPYPSKDQKDQLAARTSMTRNQVSEWFGNMRRRIREATRGFNVCWEERVRLYNSVITGKSEPLPILPGDSINTWVPPVSEEPPSLDQHEVSVSHKFKTTLLQRYLNNSYSDTQGSSPSTTPPPEESSRYPHEHQDSSTGGEYSLTFSHPSPLRTSSPREGFRALWNSSFEHVKDNRVPATEHRGKVHRSRLKGEEGDRGVRKYERHRNQNCVPSGLKRQKTSTWSEGGHLHGSSSLLPPFPLLPVSRVGVGREEPRERVGPVRLQLPSWAARSTLSGVRFADEDCGINQGLRQPEELAAAYTLMQLQHM